MDFIDKIRKVIKMRHDDVVVAMTNGNVDSMEKYQYMLGQIRTYQYLLQEISTLLKTKEQNDSEGTIISIKTKDSSMDSDFSKHKDRYTFSGKKSTPAKRLRSRKTVTKKERLFATSVAAGHGVVAAYQSSFGNSMPDQKARAKAVILLKQERVMKEIEKSVMDVAKSMGIDHQYVLNNLKILCESSEDENIVLQSTKELGKAIGTLGAPQKKNVEMGIYGMMQQFSPEEIDEAKRPMLEEVESE